MPLGRSRERVAETVVRPARIAARVLVVAAIAVGVGAASFEALFAPKAEIWPRWTAHDPAATARIDHALWDRLTQTYVQRHPSGVNRFAYDRVTAADRQALSDYLAALAATPISRHARHEQFAYWVNLYNALTVKVVLDRYPVASIRDIDISPGWFADGPWAAKLVTVEGESISLNDIEHRILRPIWRDPRIHYAVNCASIGCPNLMPRAFSAASMEAMLERAAREFVNHPRGARVEAGRLTVSSIYVWFGDDFGGANGVIAHLRRYAEGDLARDLAAAGGIDRHGYDWALNAP
jgi:hypothetical protein